MGKVCHSYTHTHSDYVRCYDVAPTLLGFSDAFRYAAGRWQVRDYTKLVPSNRRFVHTECRWCRSQSQHNPIMGYGYSSVFKVIHRHSHANAGTLTCRLAALRRWVSGFGKPSATWFSSMLNWQRIACARNRCVVSWARMFCPGTTLSANANNIWEWIILLDRKVQTTRIFYANYRIYNIVNLFREIQWSKYIFVSFFIVVHCFGCQFIRTNANSLHYQLEWISHYVWNVKRFLVIDFVLYGILSDF